MTRIMKIPFRKFFFYRNVWCRFNRFSKKLKTVMTVIQCGLKFFELIKTVMEINSLARHFFATTDLVFFFSF